MVRLKVLSQLLSRVLFFVSASSSSSFEFLGAVGIAGCGCAVLIWGARTYRYEVSSCYEEPVAAAAEDENDAATNSTTPTPTNDHASVRGSRVQRAPIPSSVSTASNTTIVCIIYMHTNYFI